MLTDRVGQNHKIANHYVALILYLKSLNSLIRLESCEWELEEDQREWGQSKVFITPSIWQSWVVLPLTS